MNLPKHVQRIVIGTLALFVMTAVTAARAAEQGSHVGIVIMAVGKVVATDNSGTSRQLKRRSKLYNTDLISTESGARAQIRFSDGELLSLQENTQFKIEDYRYKSASGKKDNAAYSLLKGSMRTISGAIGKKDRSEYKVKTPVATIGIRGTDYELVLHNNKSGNQELFGYINHGKINVANSSGSTNIGLNEYFAVTGKNQPPRQLLNPPSFMFKGYVPPEPKVGNNQNPILQGESTGIDNLLTSSAGSLTDLTNPAFTPFSTVSHLTGTFYYFFDTTSGGGLPTVTALYGTSVTATSASSSFMVDFDTQMISNASAYVNLSDSTSMSGSSSLSYSLADVINGGQSITLTGLHYDAALAPLNNTSGTLTLQGFVGSQAQGALAHYTLSDDATPKNPMTVTGDATYYQSSAY